MEEKELLEKEQKDEAPKKPIYKKWWFWVIIGVAVLSIAFAGVGSGTQNEETDGEGKLGKYTVSILGYRFAEDYDGENVIIVKYNFKNNSDENAAFYLTFDASAYQNGIGLNECYFVDESANYSSDNQTKEIKPGANIDVEEAYLLNDNTSSIDIEVKELFSFSDDVIKKTFVINEGGSQTDNSSKEEQNNQSTETVKNNLGKFYVEILGYRLGEDYMGDAIVIVEYKFTNNGDDSAAFMWTFDENVFQNGIGLNECYLVDSPSDYSADNQTKEIKTGASLTVEVAYELNDTETDIEVEVKELFSFKDEVVKKTFAIK